MTDDANTPASSGSSEPVAKPKKIVREEIKDRHTRQWDMEMMSSAELEALLAQKATANAK